MLWAPFFMFRNGLESANKLSFWELLYLCIRKDVIQKVLVCSSSQFTKQVVMKIFSRGTLREFWKKHQDCELQLKTWYRETEQANWQHINQIKSEYPSASILKDNRIVFNIKGNHYRLIVKFNFEYQLAWIRFIGTHAEYDKINANEVWWWKFRRLEMKRTTEVHCKD